MARELGISESQARTGAEALAPAILGGLLGGNPLDDIMRKVNP